MKTTGHVCCLVSAEPCNLQMFPQVPTRHVCFGSTPSPSPSPTPFSSQSFTIQFSEVQDHSTPGAAQTGWIFFFGFTSIFYKSIISFCLIITALSFKLAFQWDDNDEWLDLSICSTFIHPSFHPYVVHTSFQHLSFIHPPLIHPSTHLCIVSPSSSLLPL